MVVFGVGASLPRPVQADRPDQQNREAAEAMPLNASDDKSAARSAPTAAPAAVPMPPKIWAAANTKTTRR
jgi:hypothetical protein